MKPEIWVSVLPWIIFVIGIAVAFGGNFGRSHSRRWFSAIGGALTTMAAFGLFHYGQQAEKARVAPYVDEVYTAISFA